MAGRLSGDWFVVYVETPREAPDRIDAEAQRHLLANIELARELGAEVVRLQARDPVHALIDFARSHGVGHLVIGRSQQPWWRQVARPLGAAAPARARRATSTSTSCVDRPTATRTGHEDAHEAAARAAAARRRARRRRSSSAASVTRALGRGSQHILKDNYRSVLAAERMKEAAERIDSGVVFAIIGRAGARARADRREPAEVRGRAARRRRRNITEPGEREATAALRAAWTAYRARRSRASGRAPDAVGLDDRYFADVAAGVPRGQGRGRRDPRDEPGRDDPQERPRAATSRASRTRCSSRSRSRGCVLGLVASSVITRACCGRSSCSVRPRGGSARATSRCARASTRGDEIGELARELNTMAERIQRYRESSLGELLEAQLAAQADDRQPSRPGARDRARRRAPSREPGGRDDAQGAARTPARAAIAALEPAVRSVGRAAAPARRRRPRRVRAEGPRRGDRGRDRRRRRACCFRAPRRSTRKRATSSARRSCSRT